MCRLWLVVYFCLFCVFSSQFGFLRGAKAFDIYPCLVTRWSLTYFNSKDDIEVNMSCEVQPSQSWCVMFPVMFEEVTSVGTVCAAQATDKDGVAINGSESSGWALCDVGKRCRRHGDLRHFPARHFFWADLQNFSLMCSEARASFQSPGDRHGRLLQHHLGPQLPDGLPHLHGPHQRSPRASKGNVHGKSPTTRAPALPTTCNATLSPQEPVYSLSSDGKRLQLDHKRLQPGVNYTVDVKAKMCPSNLYNGPWSEWSSTAHFRSAGPDDVIPSSRGAESKRGRRSHISELSFLIIIYSPCLLYSDELAFDLHPPICFGLCHFIVSNPWIYAGAAKEKLYPSRDLTLQTSVTLKMIHIYLFYFLPLLNAQL